MSTSITPDPGKPPVKPPGPPEPPVKPPQPGEPPVKPPGPKDPPVQPPDPGEPPVKPPGPDNPPVMRGAGHRGNRTHPPPQRAAGDMRGYRFARNDGLRPANPQVRN